jgi:hypothetical protein
MKPNPKSVPVVDARLGMAAVAVGGTKVAADVTVIVAGKAGVLR